MLAISGQVGEIIYYYFHLTNSLKNVYVNILCFFLLQLQRQNNYQRYQQYIIGVGYSITIIKGQYSLYTGCYSFQRNNRFDYFRSVLNIIPISFKIFIIINLFTFLHKGREQIYLFFVVSMKFLFWYSIFLINEICK